MTNPLKKTLENTKTVIKNLIIYAILSEFKQIPESYNKWLKNNPKNLLKVELNPNNKLFVDYTIKAIIQFLSIDINKQKENVNIDNKPIINDLSEDQVRDIFDKHIINLRIGEFINKNKGGSKKILITLDNKVIENWNKRFSQPNILLDSFETWFKQLCQEYEEKTKKQFDNLDTWQQIKSKIPDEFDLLDQEFFQRREGDEVKILNVPSATWSLIIKRNYVDRDQQEEALTLAKNLSSSQGISFLLIRGIPGDGKTALMKWLVYQLSNNGYIVLQRNREQQYWLESLEQFSKQNQGQHFYLFADDLFRDDFLIDELRRASELQFPLTIIGTTRDNEDRQKNYLTKPGYPIKNLDLKLSDDEKKRILAKIQEQDPKAAARLAQKTPQEINELMKFSSTMLVLMLQLSEGKTFDSIIADVIKRLPNKQDDPVYDVFGVICCFYQYGIAVYPDILPLCLPEYSKKSIFRAIDSKKTSLKSLVKVVTKSRFEGLIAVHEEIAKAVVQARYHYEDRENKPYPSNLLEESLRSAISNINITKETHKTWLRYQLRALAANNQQNLLLEILKNFDDTIKSIQYQENTITDWITWKNIYNLIKLSDQEDRCIQYILSTKPKDSAEYQYKLSLIIQNSTQEQIKNKEIIEETAIWLEEHRDNTNVRQQYLELIQTYGTTQQKQNIIPNTTKWLKDHPDDTNVRAKYLALVGKEFTIIEDIQLIIDQQWQWISQQNKVEQFLWSAFFPVVFHHAKNNIELIRQASQLARKQHPKDFVIACAVFYFQDYLDLKTCYELADFIYNSKLPKKFWYKKIFIANFYRDYSRNHEDIEKAKKIYLTNIKDIRDYINKSDDELENRFDFACLNYARLLILSKPPQWKKAREKYLKPLLDKKSKHSLAHLYMAQCYIEEIRNYKQVKSNMYNPIIHHFREAVNYEKDLAEKSKYEYEFGNFYWKTKKDKMKAREHFCLSITHKNNLPACVALAELNLEEGNKAEAQKYIEQGLAIEILTRLEKEEKQKLMTKIKNIQQQLSK